MSQPERNAQVAGSLATMALHLGVRPTSANVDNRSVELRRGLCKGCAESRSYGMG
jgi:hypothetical protein